MSGSAKPTRRGTYFRNTDASMDVGSRKRMEQVFDKTEGITMKYFTINRSVIDKSIDTDPIDFVLFHTAIYNFFMLSKWLTSSCRFVDGLSDAFCCISTVTLRLLVIAVSILSLITG